LPVDPSNCSYLTDLTGNVPWVRSLAVAGTDGRIKCSTDPAAIGLNVSDRPHIQKALHSRDFALSDYLINRIYQVPNLVATYPVIAEDKSVSGVVLAVINLQWINELAATAARAPR
jgi:hypothetical protein